MHWKFKSKVQNIISILPPSISYSTYYWLQRHFGNLKQLNPTQRLNAGIEAWEHIQGLGYDPIGSQFFEIGTGRVPIVPFAYWLMGAEKTITIDVNPYLKEELIIEFLEYISNHREEIKKIFGKLLIEERLETIIERFKSGSFTSDSFLNICNVEYISPADASKTNLKSNSIDFHTSCAVFEHIPSATLKAILEEGNRIVKSDGLFLHRIDYRDHFAYSDQTISPINFLQYSDSEWDKYAGNRYMYMNRLRHDDYIALFESCGHRIMSNKPDKDFRVFDLLKSNGLSLDKRFRDKDIETLSMVSSWIVTNTKKAI